MVVRPKAYREKWWYIPIVTEGCIIIARQKVFTTICIICYSSSFTSFTASQRSSLPSSSSHAHPRKIERRKERISWYLLKKLLLDIFLLLHEFFSHRSFFHSLFHPLHLFSFSPPLLPSPTKESLTLYSCCTRRKQISFYLLSWSSVQEPLSLKNNAWFVFHRQTGQQLFFFLMRTEVSCLCYSRDASDAGGVL